MTKSVLVTGATGFIGQALINELLTNHDFKVIAGGLRQHNLDLPHKVTQSVVGDISAFTDWSASLRTIDVIIHVAGRAHVLKEDSDKAIDRFREVNTTGTLNLARQAIKAGVHRLIFISSIGVNGNYNTCPFIETDKTNPQEPYAVSKYEAELGLLALAAESEMDIVIIRPPLVYGINAPGNFGRLLQWVNNGVPLPLGAVHNQRSLIALDNLMSFIIICIDHIRATNEVFLISDGEDISTTKLLQKVAKALDKKTFLLPVPVGLMRFMAKLISKTDEANRLFGSLRVDSSKARDLLGWKPVITMDEQLKKIADVYVDEKII